MADPSLPRDKLDPEAMKRQIQSQHRRVLGLRAQLYSQTDPSTGEALRQRLADEEATLRRLEDEQREFKDFLNRLRRAKDKAEFDQFMAERGRRNAAPDAQPQG